MEPPTIYVPAGSVEAIEQLLRAFQKLDRGGMPVRLVGVMPGEEVELSRELVVSVFATKHTLPSLGFLVWERRKKLKPEYTHLSNEEIRDLRLSGVEVSREIRIPKVAYMGDTAPAGLDAFPDVYKAEVLIMEMTFVGQGELPHKIHKFGHTHLDDFLARGRSVRERADPRLAFQHPAAPRPDPADRRETPARPAPFPPSGLALIRYRNSLPSAFTTIAEGRKPRAKIRNPVQKLQPLPVANRRLVEFPVESDFEPVAPRAASRSLAATRLTHAPSMSVTPIIARPVRGGRPGGCRRGRRSPQIPGSS